MMTSSGASSPPRKRGSRGNRHSARNLVVQVAPGRIGFLDQLHFPSSAPTLDALFAQDGFLHRGMKLCVSEGVDPVPVGEAICDVDFVLPDPPVQVAGDPHIERSVPTVSKNVGAGLHIRCIIPSVRERWTPAFAGVTKPRS